MAAFSYIFNIAAQHYCIIYPPDTLLGSNHSRKGGKTRELYCFIKDSKGKEIYHSRKGGKTELYQHNLFPKTRHGRNRHSKAFQTASANTDVYKCSFFPKTIRDWNVLPDSLISSAEVAEDCVSKFTSVVRARDISS